MTAAGDVAPGAGGRQEPVKPQARRGPLHRHPHIVYLFDSLTIQAISLVPVTKPTKLVVIIDIVGGDVSAWVHGRRPVAASSENGSVLDVSPHVWLPWAGRS